MTASILKRNNTHLMVFLASTLVLNAFLFFIDEGYYNFEWMSDPFAWGIFTVYAIPVFGAQLLIYSLFPIKTGKTIKYVTSILIGSIIGITLTVSGFYLFL